MNYYNLPRLLGLPHDTSLDITLNTLPIVNRAAAKVFRDQVMRFHGEQKTHHQVWSPGSSLQETFVDGWLEEIVLKIPDSLIEQWLLNPKPG